MHGAICSGDSSSTVNRRVTHDGIDMYAPKSRHKSLRIRRCLFLLRNTHSSICIFITSGHTIDLVSSKRGRASTSPLRTATSSTSLRSDTYPNSRHLRKSPHSKSITVRRSSKSISMKIFIQVCCLVAALLAGQTSGLPVAAAQGELPSCSTCKTLRFTSQ